MAPLTRSETLAPAPAPADKADKAEAEPIEVNTDDSEWEDDFDPNEPLSADINKPLTLRSLTRTVRRLEAVINKDERGQPVFDRIPLKLRDELGGILDSHKRQLQNLHQASEFDTPLPNLMAAAAKLSGTMPPKRKAITPVIMSPLQLDSNPPSPKPAKRVKRVSFSAPAIDFNTVFSSPTKVGITSARQDTPHPAKVDPNRSPSIDLVAKMHIAFQAELIEDNGEYDADPNRYM